MRKSAWCQTCLRSPIRVLGSTIRAWSSPRRVLSAGGNPVWACRILHTADDPVNDITQDVVDDKVGKSAKRRKRAKPVQDLPPSIIAGSSNHHDLQSFLAYATRVRLDTSTTVFVGTHYEYMVSDALRKLGFDLTRTGRASDLGVDLLGSWNLPGPPGQIRVLLQCKAEKPKPSFVRELEGASIGAPSGWQGDSVLALLVASKEATKGVREGIMRSRWPMGFLNVSTEGVVRQFIWNQKAAEKGLEGIGVALKHRPIRVGVRGKADTEQEVTLTWQALPWTT